MGVLLDFIKISSDCNGVPWVWRFCGGMVASFPWSLAVESSYSEFFLAVWDLSVDRFSGFLWVLLDFSPQKSSI